MAAKTRKCVSRWYTCESCHVMLTYKDVALHQEGYCPPLAENCAHGFISNNVLCGFLEELMSTDGLQFVPRREHTHLVFLSISAMQLCGIAIGDPVVVGCGSLPIVMTAWPLMDKPLLTVHMLRESIDCNWECSGTLVKVHGLSQPPSLAQEVAVCCSSSSSIPSNTASLLRSHYNNKILCVGRYLSLPNYGQKLRFQVKHLLPFGPENTPGEVSSLADGLDKMSLRRGGERGEVILERVEAPLCKVVGATKWCILEESVHRMEELTRCKVALQDIGGLHSVITELEELVDLSVGSRARGAVVQGLKVARAVLLYGPAGTGKTLVAEAVAAQSGASVLRVEAPEVFSKFLGETEARLREHFESARTRAPSIVLLDGVDCLCPRHDGRGSEQERRVSAALLALLDDLHRRTEPVLVIATTSKPDDIHPGLRRPGRLDQEMEIGVPSPEARLDILCKLLCKMSHQLTAEDVRSAAFATHGFVGADLASLCAHAARRAVHRMQDGSVAEVTKEDLAVALSLVKPSAMREVLVQVPDVKWSDIGGQYDLKLKLRQAVEWPLKHPEAFSRLGILPPKGILMFGPPGCSKTMVAKALATESQLNFLSIKGPELFSKWVGESERAVREVFRRARQVAPAIVFFDELDAVGGERASGQCQSNSVQERVLAQLLTEMDGVEPLGNVIVVGATNRPDRIDKALLRPGRLDRVMYVPLPDAHTRREILLLQLCRTPVADDVDVEELVHRTQGYSGAEVLAVCTEAALKSLQEDILADRVQRSHFLCALTLVTPRTPASLLQLYQRYHTTPPLSQHIQTLFK